jgi:hypothetical protein
MILGICAGSGGFMQIDPILVISLIKQCNADAQSAELLLHWLKQANLLCCQSHGDAVSAPLVRRLTAELGPILQALAILGGDPAQQAACQQLFSQIVLFYRDLNRYDGDSGPRQTTTAKSVSCLPALDRGTNGTPAPVPVDSAQSYNLYD